MPPVKQPGLLTPTEKTVLGYIWQGFNWWRIAELMGTEHCTISTHMSNIYSKIHSAGGLPYKNDGPSELNMGRLLMRWMMDNPREWATDDPK